MLVGQLLGENLGRRRAAGQRSLATACAWVRSSCVSLALARWFCFGGFFASLLYGRFAVQSCHFRRQFPCSQALLPCQGHGGSRGRRSSRGSSTSSSGRFFCHLHTAGLPRGDEASPEALCQGAARAGLGK